MQKQNYSNHSRLIPLYHYLTLSALVAAIIGSFVNLAHSAPVNRYSASLICVMTLIMLSMFFFARIFALKAQDRAIRAEENFRHYILTGKPLDGQLKMGQIIGLRFAPDEEFIVLAKKAVDEKMNSSEIKKTIINWKADNYRV